MKSIVLFALLLTLANCFAQSPHSGLPSNIEQLIKDDYWSSSPTYSFTVRTAKENSLEYQKDLAIAGYRFTVKKEVLIDVINVNYKNTKNGFLSLLRLYKIRGFLDRSSQNCPITKSDKGVAKGLFGIPENGLLYSTINETYLKNYHRRIESYCNKTFDKGPVFILSSLFGITVNYDKYLLDSKSEKTVIGYPNF